MKYVAVLPSIYPPFTEACLRTAKFDVMVVDNTGYNKGVPASWNLGIERMNEEDADWLIVLSAGVRFGEKGGLDFIASLSDDLMVLEAGNCFDNPDLGIGWHLVAFPRWLIEAVGTFDENFYPGYWEDNDYSRRIRLWAAANNTEKSWIKKDVEATLLGASYVPDPQRPHEYPIRVGGIAHGISKGGVVVNNEKLLAYYARKWGGVPGEEMYTLPYWDKPIDYWEGMP